MTTKITEQNVSNLANFGVQWQAIHVADGSTALTVSAGKGYFIDTTSATQTVNLPANASSTAGDTIILKDYARKWATNKVTIASNTFDGVTNAPEFNTKGQTVTLVHMGTTKGWSLINEDTTTGLGAQYVAATGGTVTTSGSIKIHSFTGDSNFVVSSAGNSEGANKLDYLVVAGGGGANDTGGGGAGGMRFSAGSETGPYPLGGSGGTALTAAAQTYPITVGGGGNHGGQGSNSVFSTITSAGGGAGAHGGGGQPGGSGGGAGYNSGTGGTGNTPPVSPPQGNNGGNAPAVQGSPFRGAGGGGAGQAGGNQPGGNGGNGLVNSVTGSPVTYAGGGGGAGTSGAGGNGGCGGGGASGSHPSQDGVNGEAGTANRGSGGGSASGLPSRGTGGAGGKGIVVIRYQFQE